MRPAKRGPKPKSSVPTFVEPETTCQVCFAEFLDPDDLAQHKTQVHPEAAINLFKCNFCDAAHSDAEDYLIHIRDNHMASLVCCMYCARAFLDPQEHKEHEERHVSSVPGMLTCSCCTVMFSSIGALEKHELICNKDCKKGVMLQEHYAHLSALINTKADEFMQTLGSETTYNCCVCKIATPDINVYIRHLKKKKCRSFACNTCHQPFNTKLLIYNHFAHHPKCSHIPGIEDPLKLCTVCNQKVDRTCYKNHRKRCKPIKCVICQQKFTKIADLTEHQRNEHPMSLTLRYCRYCRQQFGGLLALRKHMLRLHADTYQMYKYVCIHCSVMFKHPNLLFNHFALKHKELRPYSCNICNETFHIRKKFTLHIKLKHDSVGFVEFDEKLNVFFGSEKSAQPFQPKENTKLFDESEKLSDESSDEPDIKTKVKEPNKENETEAPKKTLEKKKPSKTPKIKLKSLHSVSNIKTAESDNKQADKHQSEIERLCKIEPLTRKRRRLQKVIDEDFNESSDEESLQSIRKRSTKKRLIQLQMAKLNKHKFSNKITSLTCNICKKFCFTVGNYHRHMSMHYKNKSKQCIKCSESFTSNVKLEDHMKHAHSSSQITETLKKLLERRKTATDPVNKPLEAMSKRFQKTIKKVEIPSSELEVKIVPAAEKNLSVKNFIESFTPDVSDTTGKKVIVNNMVSVKPLSHPVERKPKIKFTKFYDKLDNTNTQGLKMPIAFSSPASAVTASIKLHQGSYRACKLNFGTRIHKMEDDDEINYQEYNQDDELNFGDDADEQTAMIPDVAHEVMLENTEEQQKTTQIAHKLMIPKTKLNQKIKIAHLQPEAPFFKIVSFDDVMKSQAKANRTNQTEEDTPEIYLPSGTKLVHANPLAHLLEGKSLDEFRKFRDRKQKYRPKYDHKTALTQALINLENPKPPKKRPFQKRAPRKKNVALSTK